jgi:hypothetical protein
MGVRVRIGVVIAASILATLSLPAVARGADGAASAAPTIRAVPLRSSYETATRALSRDIGVSVLLPDGHDLWLFGDTSVYTLNSKGAWVNTGFVDGSTALEGRAVRGQVPHGAEVPKGSPSRFIPVPTNVYLPDGTKRPCVKSIGDAAFSARWPTGAAVLPSNPSEILVTYSEVCVTVPAGKSPTERAEGWGFLLYNWRVRRIAVGPVDVFRPHATGAAIDPSLSFGWPVYVKGQVTLFSSSCTSQYLTCGSGNVWSVTTPKLSDPNSYKPALMLTDGSTTWQPMSISVGQYAAGLRMIETTSIGGDYDILGAATLGAPWHLLQSSTLPDCDPNIVGYCHGVEGHPELSTPTSIFISYKDPNSGPGGHMVVSAVPE